MLTLENYEIMFVFLADLGEDAINKELGEFRKDISTGGGNITHEDSWGLREMSYRIKKQERGFYVVLNFSLSPEKIAEIQKNYTIDPKVIRFLIVKTPSNYLFKTFEEYQLEAAKIAEEAAKEKAEKDEKRMKREEPRFKGPKAAVPTKAVALAKEVAPAKAAAPAKAVAPAKEKSITEEAPKAAESKAVAPAKEKSITADDKKPRKEASTKSKLDEFDEKLKNIINDPDITL